MKKAAGFIYVPILFFLICSATFFVPSSADAWPTKFNSCTACHSTVDADANIYVAVDGIETSTVIVDAGNTVEIDWYFTNATEAPVYGIGIQVVVPDNWTVSSGTSNFPSMAGWSTAWDATAGVGWSMMYDTNSQFPGTDGATIDFGGSPWDTGTGGRGSRNMACDEGPSCSAGGTDLDGMMETMGADVQITVPSATAPGTYPVYVFGIGHDAGSGKTHVMQTIDIVVAGVQVDDDSDGYTSDVDCDDNDPAINPGAVEDCTDGIDNDCDNLIDTADPDAIGCLVCTDDDNDGYAIEGGACGPVDCDDTDRFVSPGRVEICANAIDDDCDALVDVDDTDCADDDGDGYLLDVDCDDSDPAINPGAVEDCSDGIDNDCDYLIDLDDPDAVGCPACTDNDGDGYFVEGGECGPVDCDDANVIVNPGRWEICDNGRDDECDGLTDGADPDCAVPGCSDYTNRTDCRADSTCEWVGGKNNGSCQDAQTCTITEDPEVSCSDGVDNDCDGNTDSSDADCGGGTSEPEICDDGIDNDLDGKTDCSDKKDCGKDPAC